MYFVEYIFIFLFFCTYFIGIRLGGGVRRGARVVLVGGRASAGRVVLVRGHMTNQGGLTHF